MKTTQILPHEKYPLYGRRCVKTVFRSGPTLHGFLAIEVNVKHHRLPIDKQLSITYEPAAVHIHVHVGETKCRLRQRTQVKDTYVHEDTYR